MHEVGSTQVWAPPPFAEAAAILRANLSKLSADVYTLPVAAQILRFTHHQSQGSVKWYVFPKSQLRHHCPGTSTPILQTRLNPCHTLSMLGCYFL